MICIIFNGFILTFKFEILNYCSFISEGMTETRKIKIFEPFFINIKIIFTQIMIL